MQRTLAASEAKKEAQKQAATGLDAMLEAMRGAKKVSLSHLPVRRCAVQAHVSFAAMWCDIGYMRRCFTDKLMLWQVNVLDKSRADWGEVKKDSQASTPRWAIS